MEKIGNKKDLLEKYLVWGKKVDFSSFSDYINRNLVVDFKIKEFYDFKYLKDIIENDVAQGIEHYCRENDLFFPFFSNLFDFDRFTLYLVGKYKDINIKYELGKVDVNLKDNKFLVKRKMLDFPKFRMKKMENNVILFADFLKSIINETLDNKVLELETNLKNLDNLKKEYNSRKNKYKKMKIK